MLGTGPVLPPVLPRFGVLPDDGVLLSFLADLVFVLRRRGIATNGIRKQTKQKIKYVTNVVERI